MSDLMVKERDTAAGDMFSKLRTVGKLDRANSQALSDGGGRWSGKWRSLATNGADRKEGEALSGHGFPMAHGLVMRDGVQPIGRSLRPANQRRAECQLWPLWACGLARSLQNIPPTGHLQGHCRS